MLRCADDTLYTGVTTDVDRRLHQHNNTKAGAAYTKARRPVALEFRHEVESKSAALKVEYAIKQLTRAQKLELASGLLPIESVASDL